MRRAALRVLVVTKIFPSSLEPHSSPFNRQQFAELGRLCDVEVLATIPWFPLSSLAGTRTRANTLAHVPRAERIDGLNVVHPRFLYLPRIGDAVASSLYAASLLAEVRRRRSVDLILASWAYPDGAAAVMLGALFGIPVAIKLHGSDINVMGERRVVRAHLRRTLPRAAAVVSVSKPLGERAIELGAPRARTFTVANGTDLEKFAVRDRVEARRRLGLPEKGRLITFVGRLTQEKGVFDLLDAFAVIARSYPDVTLVLVGDGDARQHASSLGDRVRVVGARPHAEIPDFLSAADVFTLPSWSEGTPNVVLEALASGRRVVATNVGGIPDVVRTDELGALVPPRDPRALARALGAALDRAYDPAVIARLAPIRSWADSARELHAVLSSAARGGAG